MVFLSTPSARRATRLICRRVAAVVDFYPRPPRGGRPGSWHHRRGAGHFYPRPPRGGRPVERVAEAASSIFLSTPSARRATEVFVLGEVTVSISIHALREEGDCLGPPFLGRPRNFYPRPPRGGRPAALGFEVVEKGISIHALREEGDGRLPHKAAPKVYFYPRPPRGGRQQGCDYFATTDRISIHALREEGDLGLACCGECGAISIHALREEGDHRATQDHQDDRISIHALREEGDSKNRDKISIFKQIIQHSARI